MASPRIYPKRLGFSSGQGGEWLVRPRTCPSALVAEQLFPEPARALVFQESCSLLPPPVPIFTKVSYGFLQLLALTLTLFFNCCQLDTQRSEVASRVFPVVPNGTFRVPFRWNRREHPMQFRRFDGLYAIFCLSR